MPIFPTVLRLYKRPPGANENVRLLLYLNHLLCLVRLLVSYSQAKSLRTNLISPIRSTVPYPSSPVLAPPTPLALLLPTTGLHPSLPLSPSNRLTFLSVLYTLLQTF